MIETELIAGLYDENDNLIVTYEESGLIADAIYTSSSYKTDAGSGYSTFKRYPVAKKVILPASIANVGDYAFAGCTALVSLPLPPSVTSIGHAALFECKSLTSITIPSSVQNIGTSAFNNCTNLTTVTFAENSQCSSLGDYAFAHCSLNSITIPHSVTSIGGWVFYNCTGLTSITIGNGVTSIGESAFYGCSALVEMTIPFVGAKAGVTSSDTDQYPFGYIFGTSSYTGCVKITQVYYGISTSRTTSSTYYIPSSLKSVTVTGGNILRGAFYNCKNLTDIVLGSNIVNIGESAFHFCSKLANIELQNIQSISNDAFNNCSSLVTLDLPDSLTYLSAQAFTGCTALQEIHVGSGLSNFSTWYNTDYDNGLHVDLSRASNLETVSVHGNVYFGPASQRLGLNGQFKAADDGSLYRWSSDLNA